MKRFCLVQEILLIFKEGALDQIHLTYLFIYFYFIFAQGYNHTFLDDFKVHNINKWLGSRISLPTL